MLRSKSKVLQDKMASAQLYSDWVVQAEDYDKHREVDKWRLEEADSRYNFSRVRDRYRALLKLREEGDHRKILFHLNEGIHGNLEGMGRPSLYTQSMLGTKKLIEDYVELICDCLRIIADVSEAGIAFDEKLDFFRRASRCYGRSALSLSGAAGLIYFHHGVVRALLEHQLLPKVISGSSAGAWLCCQIGTQSEDELRDHLKNQRYQTVDGDTRLSLPGMFCLLAASEKKRSQGRDELIDAFVPDMTFQEAFEHSGRYINISVAPSEQHQNSRLLNVFTSPNVTLASAARATSAIPGLFEPVQLYAKNSSGKRVKYLPGRRWVDGSVSDDLPFKRLSRLYGVNHFIVSMANPVVVPILGKEPKLAGESLFDSAEAYVRSVATHTFKESVKFWRNMNPPFMHRSVDSRVTRLDQLLGQDYHGDINIVMPRKNNTLRRFFFSYKSDEDIKNLILAGERSTWPKIGQIKNSLAISHTLNEILTDLDRESVETGHKVNKNHMVV